MKAETIRGDVSIEGMNRHESISGYHEFGKTMNQRPLTAAEKKALIGSYQKSGYDDINGQLRSGKGLTPEVVTKIQQLDTATRAGTIPAGTVLYRGVNATSKVADGHPSEWVEKGLYHHDNGFVSTSTSKQFASGWSGSSGVVFEYRVKKPTEGVHLWQAGSTTHENEREVVMPRAEKLWKMVGYRREEVGGSERHIVTLDQT